jgi:hypothetical protein
MTDNRPHTEILTVPGHLATNEIDRQILQLVVIVAHFTCPAIFNRDVPPLYKASFAYTFAENAQTTSPHVGRLGGE